MKTKQVPVIITLIAGLITCILGFKMHMGTAQFVRTLVIILISFYILGCIAKLVLDKNFKEEPEEEATEEAGEESVGEGTEGAEETTEESTEASNTP
ncbi:MAG: hypothetical protein HFH36_06580 [Lachnospiraceae bacterium]|nr:hypothetical protein [Lachnospiraceae bacterium]